MGYLITFIAVCVACYYLLTSGVTLKLNTNSTTAAPQKSIPASAKIIEKLNTDLVIRKGKELVPFKLNPNTDYIAIYFSAHWCPPCRAFTPDLVNFYKKFKPQHPNFELIFVSRDNSFNEMATYIGETDMTWPLISFDRADSNFMMNYCGNGIPSLVLIDAAGNVISNSYNQFGYRGPRPVLSDIESIVK